MINVGVIGCGQWGPNHIRNFSHLSGSRVLMCSDLNEARLKTMKETFRNIHPTKDYKEIIEHPKINAVIIATPTETHPQLVKECLLAGKDVLCEKPLAVRTEEIEELAQLAGKNKCILMVGHVFIFNEAIQRLKKYISDGELGAIQYAHSTRTNLGPFRYDVSAVWDLAPHDIAMFNYFFGGMPEEVSARGHKCMSDEREDLGFITLTYPENICVNIHVSWIDPKKVRTITIVGEKKMVTWDDLSSSAPIMLYDKHVEKDQPYYETFGEFQLLSKEGDITIPNIPLKESLKNQAAYFLECITKRKQPELADVSKALAVTKTLIAVQESMDKKGACISVAK